MKYHSVIYNFLYNFFADNTNNYELTYIGSIKSKLYKIQWFDLKKLHGTVKQLPKNYQKFKFFDYQYFKSFIFFCKFFVDYKNNEHLPKVHWFQPRELHGGAKQTRNLEKQKSKFFKYQLSIYIYISVNISVSVFWFLYVQCVCICECVIWNQSTSNTHVS